MCLYTGSAGTALWRTFRRASRGAGGSGRPNRLSRICRNLVQQPRILLVLISMVASWCHGIVAPGCSHAATCHGGALWRSRERHTIAEALRRCDAARASSECIGAHLRWRGWSETPQAGRCRCGGGSQTRLHSRATARRAEEARTRGNRAVVPPPATTCCDQLEHQTLAEPSKRASHHHSCRTGTAVLPPRGRPSVPAPFRRKRTRA